MKENKTDSLKTDSLKTDSSKINLFKTDLMKGIKIETGPLNIDSHSINLKNDSHNINLKTHLKSNLQIDSMKGLRIETGPLSIESLKNETKLDNLTASHSSLLDLSLHQKFIILSVFVFLVYWVGKTLGSLAQPSKKLSVFKTPAPVYKPAYYHCRSLDSDSNV